MTKCTTPVFRDKKGNRFIFPSFIVRDESESSPPKYDIRSQAHNLTIFLDITLEDEWMDFDDECFPHVSGELRSNAFLHGYATTYTFDGPQFTFVVKECMSDTNT